MSGEGASARVQLHVHLAQRVLALGDRIDPVQLEGVLLRLDDAVDGVERRVHRAVAQAHVLELLPVLHEADRAGRRGEVGGVHGEPVQLEAVLHLVVGGGGVGGDGHDVVVGHVLLLVAQRLELLEAGVQLLGFEDVAQLLQPLLEGVAAGVLAQHQVVRGDAHGLGGEDLVGLLVRQHAVLMDAGLVQEGVAAHDGLVQRRALADDVVHRLAGAVDLGGIDARLLAREHVGARAHRHHDLLQRGVACALAQAVDGALDLPRAAQHAAQGVGHRHAQVVVAVHGVLHLVGAGHVADDRLDQRLHLTGRGVAHGVGQVDDRRAVADGNVHHLAEEVHVAAGRVLGGELDVGAVLPRVGHHLCGALQHLLRGHLQLVLHVHRGGGDEEVDAGVGSALDRLPGAVDVLLRGAGEGGHRAVLDRLGDGRYGLKVARRRDRKARFDHVHFQTLQAARHLQLFLQVHAAARRLLSIPQCGIEDFNLAHLLYLSVLAILVRRSLH